MGISYSSASERGVGGVELLLSSFASGCLSSVVSISDRILAATFRAQDESGFPPSIIVSCYGPTNVDSEDIRTNFFSQLYNFIAIPPHYFLQMLMI